MFPIETWIAINPRSEIVAEETIEDADIDRDHLTAIVDVHANEEDLGVVAALNAGDATVTIRTVSLEGDVIRTPPAHAHLADDSEPALVEHKIERWIY